jgi:hypothetical protein
VDEPVSADSVEIEEASPMCHKAIPITDSPATVKEMAPRGIKTLLDKD